MGGGKPRKKMTPAEECVVDTALRWADASSDAVLLDVGSKSRASRDLAVKRAKSELNNLMAACATLVRERDKRK